MSFSLDDIYKAANRWRQGAREAAMDARQKADWVWEALQGDFNPNRSMGQIGFDTVLCLVPGVDTVSVDNDIRRLENYTDPAGFTAYQTRLNGTAFANARTSAGTLIKSSNIVRVRFRLPDVNLSHEDVPGDGIHASDISIIGAIKIQ